jgi:hypothetical protein
MPTQTGPATETRPQHLGALERANAIRLQQAMVKRWIREPGDMHESRARAAKLVRNPGDASFLGELGVEALSRMKIGALLSECNRTGPVVVRKLLRRLDVNELRAVGQLTPNQADRIVRALCGGHTEQLEFALGAGASS